MRGTAQMTNKMNSIIIPHIEFRDTTIREAIDFLRQQAAENDPSGQGVNIVLRLVPLGQVALPSTPVQPAALPEGTAVSGAGASPAGAAAPSAGAPARGRPGAVPVAAPLAGPAAAPHHRDAG